MIALAALSARIRGSAVTQTQKAPVMPWRTSGVLDH